MRNELMLIDVYRFIFAIFYIFVGIYIEYIFFRNWKKKVFIQKLSICNSVTFVMEDICFTISYKIGNYINFSHQYDIV